jgi:cytochrome d ubiquinol oxidase subunit I
MELDPLFLSRVQFAFVVSFHVIFPAFTIALAAFIAVLEGLYLFTKREHYLNLSKFWTKIFAVSFGLGVVSGIVMAYQFGTNWSGLIERAGGVLGPLLAYEVLTAFFLEATFLGIMLFGRGRVPKTVHFTAVVLVALGTSLSMFWIIAANSWLHTPAGYFIDEAGRVRAEDWFAVIFNPSTAVRFAHMGLAAFLTTAFVIAGVSARALLRGEDKREARSAFAMSMGFIMLVAPMQMFVGHEQGMYLSDDQPAKLAAIEGHWESGPSDLVLFALPNESAERNDMEVKVPIPGLASYLNTGEFDAELPGLNEFAEEDRPPVWPVFWSFRIMVGIGILMFITAIVGVVLLLSGKLFTARSFQRWSMIMIPSGFIAVETGWFTAEIGRQPWIAFDLMRTAEAVSPVTGIEVLTSLIAFILVYALIFGAGIYFLIKIVRSGMGGPTEPGVDRSADRPKRPWSAADESFDDTTAVPAE